MTRLHVKESSRQEKGAVSNVSAVGLQQPEKETPCRPPRRGSSQGIRSFSCECCNSLTIRMSGLDQTKSFLFYVNSDEILQAIRIGRSTMPRSLLPMIPDPGRRFNPRGSARQSAARQREFLDLLSWRRHLPPRATKQKPNTASPRATAIARPDHSPRARA